MEYTDIYHKQVKRQVYDQFDFSIEETRVFGESGA